MVTGLALTLSVAPFQSRLLTFTDRPYPVGDYFRHSVTALLLAMQRLLAAPTTQPAHVRDGERLRLVPYML